MICKLNDAVSAFSVQSLPIVQVTIALSDVICVVVLRYRKASGAVFGLIQIFRFCFEQNNSKTIFERFSRIFARYEMRQFKLVFRIFDMPAVYLLYHMCMH